MSSPLLCALLGAIFCAGGCSALSGPELVPGVSSGQDVVNALGRPAEVSRLANGETQLWYPRPIPDRAYGYENYVARIAADGRLIALEQRLTDENVAKLIPGASRAHDVRNMLGPPYRSYRLFEKPREVWEYQLEGFQRPVTLYVQLSPDEIVREVFMLERRGESSRAHRPRSRR